MNIYIYINIYMPHSPVQCLAGSRVGWGGIAMPLHASEEALRSVGKLTRWVCLAVTVLHVPCSLDSGML